MKQVERLLQPVICIHSALFSLSYKLTTLCTKSSYLSNGPTLHF